MSTKVDLKDYIIEALNGKENRQGSIIEISKYVWNRHQGDLYNGGNIFYTWQYDIRWAATELRRENRLDDGRGIWRLLNQ
jgi:hypothetical protein